MREATAFCMDRKKMHGRYNMEYIKYYEEIVKRRHSCRNFTEKKVEDSALDEVKSYYEECESLVPSIETELVFFDRFVGERLGASVGYNGFIIKAPEYFAVFSDPEEHYLENAGFIAQGITLKLTQLNIAACWLTVNDAEFAKKALGINTDKKFAAVVAFGYRNKEGDDLRLDIVSPSNVKMVKVGEKVAPKMSLNDLLYHKRYGKPLEETLFSELEDALRAISTSQSFFNRQPYRVIVDDDMISLIGLPDDMTSESDACLNYGIVMFNFYSVMDSVRTNAAKWSFEPAGRELGLPDGCTYIAKCRI